MSKRTAVVFIFVFVVILGAFFGSASGAEKVKIAMGYIPNVQFAPYYLAQELGYFSDEGLDVEFDYGWATDIMSLVAKGEIQFGISDGDQVIIARDKGVPVKAVYAMYVKYPIAVVSKKEKGITTPAMLIGKTIGVPAPYGSNYIGLRLLLASVGLEISDVNIQVIGYTQVESLVSGKVDAVTVFVNNEPFVLKDMGIDINIIPVYQITPMVSAAIITSDTLIEKNPDLVERFIRAVSNASYYALENKNGVMDLIKDYIPTLSGSNLEINRKVLFASFDLWEDEETEKYGIGYSSREDWLQAIKALKELKMIKKDISPEDCYTDRFIVGR